LRGAGEKGNKAHGLALRAHAVSHNAKHVVSLENPSKTDCNKRCGEYSCDREGPNMAGANGKGRQIVSILVVGMLSSPTLATTAFAQAGSAGGTIGKTDKSVAGSEEQRQVQPRKRSAAKREPASRSQRVRGDGGIARFDGTWTSVLGPACSSPSATFTATVAGGVISSALLSGTVSPKGEFRIVGKDGTVATGRATADSGTGTFKRADGCTGDMHSFKN
jgi:hypothetical protein